MVIFDSSDTLTIMHIFKNINIIVNVSINNAKNGKLSNFAQSTILIDKK